MSNQHVPQDSPERYLPDVLGAAVHAQDTVVDVLSIREILVGDENQLLDWAVAHHPDTEAAVATYRLNRDAQPGDVFYFADKTDPSERYTARVAERMDQDGRPAFSYKIEHPDNPKHTRSAHLLPAFVASSAEGLETKIESAQAFETDKNHLIESHPLGVGIVTLTNEFGGFSVGSDEAIEETAVDVVARALVAHQLGHATLRDVAQAGLIEPITAYTMAEHLAPMFKEVHKTADILDQLPGEARSAAGTPLMEPLLEKMRAMLHQIQPQLFLLAAVRNNPENAGRMQSIVKGQENVMDSLNSGRSVGNIDDFGFPVR